MNDEDALAWGNPAEISLAQHGARLGDGRGRPEPLGLELRRRCRADRTVALWSRRAPHEFIFPGERFGWTAWGGPPQWLRIIAADERGRSSSERAAHEGRRSSPRHCTRRAKESYLLCRRSSPDGAFRRRQLRIYVNPANRSGLAWPTRPFRELVASRRRR
jgi:hypothetical protein